MRQLIAGVKRSVAFGREIYDTDVSVAYDNYAVMLNKSVESLTLQEKQAAWLHKLMESWK